MSGPVVFVSDLGLRDEFVGVCHGVIQRIEAAEAQRAAESSVAEAPAPVVVSLAAASAA